MSTEKIVMPITQGQLWATSAEYKVFTLPEQSKWSCYMFGMGKYGMCFKPVKGKEPNFFWRWMQYICFGNEWVKGK